MMKKLYMHNPEGMVDEMNALRDALPEGAFEDIQNIVINISGTGKYLNTESWPVLVYTDNWDELLESLNFHNHPLAKKLRFFKDEDAEFVQRSVGHYIISYVFADGGYPGDGLTVVIPSNTRIPQLSVIDEDIVH